MNLVAHWKPAKIFPPCKHIGNSLFSTHDNFTVSVQNPLSFDSLEGVQRRPLLRNLISWVNAKKWLRSIRGSTLFRTIAVVQWARNLANTNMISSACPGSRQNAEIVWLLLQWKSLKWKIQHRVVSLKLPLIWQIWEEAHHSSTTINKQTKKKKIQNQWQNIYYTTKPFQIQFSITAPNRT